MNAGEPHLIRFSRPLKGGQLIRIAGRVLCALGVLRIVRKARGCMQPPRKLAWLPHRTFMALSARLACPGLLPVAPNPQKPYLRMRLGTPLGPYILGDLGKPEIRLSRIRW